MIEFTPVPANEPNDSKGWKDRDSLAAMLAASPTPPVSEDRKDAERYRWLRKHGAGFVELAISVDEDGIAQRGARIEQIPEMLDVAIDAAMQEDKQ